MSIVSRLQTSVGWRTIVITGSTAVAVSLASAWPSHASWAPKRHGCHLALVKKQSHLSLAEMEENDLAHIPEVKP